MAQLCQVKLMGRLKLTVNQEKARIHNGPEDEFGFLEYSFGQMHSARAGRAYLGFAPSKKSIKRMIEKIHALTIHARRFWTSANRRR
jgi:RNA-directed DNA polymerase